MLNMFGDQWKSHPGARGEIFTAGARVTFSQVTPVEFSPVHDHLHWQAGEKVTSHQSQVGCQRMLKVEKSLTAARTLRPVDYAVTFSSTHISLCKPTQDCAGGKVILRKSPSMTHRK